MKLWPLLLLFSFPLQAAQVISKSCIEEGAQKLEYRFTYNPLSNNLYAWERHDIAVWGNVVWHNCFLHPISPATTSVAGYIIANVMSEGIRSVTNPANGRWFATNAVGIEQDQAGLDWCTQ